jgi:hypothetical protein
VWKLTALDGFIFAFNASVYGFAVSRAHNGFLASSTQISIVYRIAIMLTYEYECMLDSTPLLLADVSHQLKLINATWSKHVQDTFANSKGDNVRLKLIFGKCTREWLNLKRLAERLGSATSVFWVPLLAWLIITLSVVVYLQSYIKISAPSYLVTSFSAVCIALVICMVGQSVSDEVKTMNVLNVHSFRYKVANKVLVIALKVDISYRYI